MSEWNPFADMKWWEVEAMSSPATPRGRAALAELDRRKGQFHAASVAAMDPFQTADNAGPRLRADLLEEAVRQAWHGVSMLGEGPGWDPHPMFPAPAPRPSAVVRNRTLAFNQEVRS